MAGYIPYNPQQYSLLDDAKFKSAFAPAQEQVKTSAMSEAPTESSIEGIDRKTLQAGAQGAQAGGLSGGLISAGAASANPYLIGGGLVLSQIEAAQKAKAMAEQERIQNEKDKRLKMMSQYNKMADMSFSI